LPTHAKPHEPSSKTCGSRPLPRGAADTAVLIVSELVTNALRHGGGTCTLELTAHPDTIEVAVHDPGSQAPHMRTPDLYCGTGEAVCARLIR
jgi:anti-sigma regulatory factor (Ser/Thr protein kinase)